jgi:hypothetical protein
LPYTTLFRSIGKLNIVSYISQTRQFINLDHGRGKGISETSPVLESAPVPQS